MITSIKRESQSFLFRNLFLLSSRFLCRKLLLRNQCFRGSVFRLLARFVRLLFRARRRVLSAFRWKLMCVGTEQPVQNPHDLVQGWVQLI